MIELHAALCQAFSSWSRCPMLYATLLSLSRCYSTHSNIEHMISSLPCISTEIPHSFWRTLACPSKLLWKSFEALESPKVPAGAYMQYMECLNTLDQTSMLHVASLSSSYSIIACHFVQKLAEKSYAWTRPNNTGPKEI